MRWYVEYIYTKILFTRSPCFHFSYFTRSHKFSSISSWRTRRLIRLGRTYSMLSPLGMHNNTLHLHIVMSVVCFVSARTSRSISSTRSKFYLEYLFSLFLFLPILPSCNNKLLQKIIYRLRKKIVLVIIFRIQEWFSGKRWVK